MRTLLLGHFILSFLFCLFSALLVAFLGPFGPDELTALESAWISIPYFVGMALFFLAARSLRKNHRGAIPIGLASCLIAAAWMARVLYYFPQGRFNQILLLYFLMGAGIAFVCSRKRRP